MRTIQRGGVYLRVADPGWSDPLDGRFSRAQGGRWNPAGSFPVVYLNRSVDVARANVYRKLDGHPYGPEDLGADAGPVLVSTEVADDRYVDIVTERGCVSAGLPPSYPFDAGHHKVGWESCQPIGQAAWDSGHPGIACRSAAFGATHRGEELAWFQRDRSRLLALAVRRYPDWFW